MEVAAYNFPNWHVSPRNEAWHGKGWTEWELLKAAKPRFPGHRQPIIPAWGYFDEADPAWAAREIDLAAGHGLTAFIYDWYWYDHAPFLHEALENGFLHARNQSRLKFALMWANHDWLNLFPALYINRPEKLASGGVSEADFPKLFGYVTERYLSKPNYLRVNGGLYFSIYELGSFLKGIGGLEAARRSLDGFRDHVRRAGLGELHLNAVVWGLNVLPSEIKLEKPGDLLGLLGFDSTTSYCWTHHYGLPEYPQSPYATGLEVNRAVWDKYARELPVPYHPNVSMGWDPSPRTAQTSPHASVGYPWMSSFSGNTPEAFEAALRLARDVAGRLPVEQQVVTINAWNEWTEGSYLLPDTVHGNAYLEAMRRVFGR